MSLSAGTRVGPYADERHAGRVIGSPRPDLTLDVQRQLADVIRLASSLLRSRAQLAAENLFLRKQ
jgi:hypothetical protein